MNYAALIYTEESLIPDYRSPEGAKHLQKYGDYSEQVLKAGVMKGGAGLLPTSSSTTVRLRDGKVLTTDGPFAETKEQLAGFYLLDCKDLDEAIKWASQIPDASIGSIEIRPVLDM